MKEDKQFFDYLYSIIVLQIDFPLNRPIRYIGDMFVPGIATILFLYHLQLIRNGKINISCRALKLFPKNDKLMFWYQLTKRLSTLKQELWCQNEKDVQKLTFFDLFQFQFWFNSETYDFFHTCWPQVSCHVNNDCLVGGIEYKNTKK